MLFFERVLYHIIRFYYKNFIKKHNFCFFDQYIYKPSPGSKYLSYDDIPLTLRKNVEKRLERFKIKFDKEFRENLLFLLDIGDKYWPQYLNAGEPDCLTHEIFHAWYEYSFSDRSKEGDIYLLKSEEYKRFVYKITSENSILRENFDFIIEGGKVYRINELCAFNVSKTNKKESIEILKINREYYTEINIDPENKINRQFIEELWKEKDAYKTIEKFLDKEIWDFY